LVGVLTKYPYRCNFVNRPFRLIIGMKLKTDREKERERERTAAVCRNQYPHHSLKTDRKRERERENSRCLPQPAPTP
jgi:hypothetical protein